MKDRIGFLTGCSEALSAMCTYYLAAGIFIMGGRWGLHLFWLLLCTALCAFLFAALLRKPRSVPMLTLVTGLLFAVVTGFFFLVSVTPLSFGYGSVLAVGAGMAVGLPLYHVLNRSTVMRHLTHLDVLILALLGVLLVREALSIDGATVALMVFVLFLDAAGAVGLRMTDGITPDSGSAFKASLTALAGAAVLAFVIALFTAVFSRSGAVTGSVLRGIGAFFAGLWHLIEQFAGRLAALFGRTDRFTAVEPAAELPSLAEAELSGGDMQIAVDPAAAAIVLAVSAAAAAAAAAFLLRRYRLARETKTTPASSEAGVRRYGGTAAVFRDRILAALRFRWTAFVNRDTPAGLLLALERRGRRLRQPRRAGETMRDFIARMDPSGGLSGLADTLDARFYGGRASSLSGRRCRELRRYIRKITPGTAGQGRQS